MQPASMGKERSGASLKVGGSGLLVLAKFIPDCVQYAEGQGEREAQNPTEVPHAPLLYLLVKPNVTTDGLESDLAAQYTVNPGGIREDDGQEHQHRHEHDE